jgi:hypothetical protein
MSSVVGAIFFQKLLIQLMAAAKEKILIIAQPLSKYTTVLFCYSEVIQKKMYVFVL